MRSNINYIVFVLYSTDYMSKRISTLLHFSLTFFTQRAAFFRIRVVSNPNKDQLVIYRLLLMSACGCAHILLTPSLQEDLERLRIDLPPVRSLQLGLIPGHEGRVGPVIQQQVDEGHLASMSQHSIQEAGGQAAGQSLLADRPRVVEVRLSAGLEQQPETVEVVVSCTDVEWTHHQRVEGAST